MDIKNGTIIQKVLALAESGRLTCAQATQLAQAEGIAPIEVGKAANAAGIKISDCQLGCFGSLKEQ